MRRTSSLFAGFSIFGVTTLVSATAFGFGLQNVSGAKLGVGAGQAVCCPDGGTFTDRHCSKTALVEEDGLVAQCVYGFYQCPEGTRLEIVGEPCNAESIPGFGSGATFLCGHVPGTWYKCV
jgi:hypothetical protein